MFVDELDALPAAFEPREFRACAASSGHARRCCQAPGIGCLRGVFTDCATSASPWRSRTFGRDVQLPKFAPSTSRIGMAVCEFLSGPPDYDRRSGLRLAARSSLQYLAGRCVVSAAGAGGGHREGCESEVPALSLSVLRRGTRGPAALIGKPGRRP
ncbi:unnamed protein product [Prorocentrum cordatum]|uniref:Uncharacterized protein n=1 Tax=Prorocentrum cordatum TaxID=2364126 RepID=A0ABN9UEI2_9DINO|nr:unnamed protein product [Polarella glacialis]